MGAWGAGSFENDAAMDFAGEIEQPADLLGPLRVRTPDDEIDVDLASQIIVVAECVAAMRGHPSPDLPDGLRATVAPFGRPGASLFHHARDHLAAVMERSELMELWTEGDPAEFNVAMHDLIQRLNRKPVVPGKAPRKKKVAFNPSICLFCDEPMGEQEFSMFSIDVDFGAGAPVGVGGWAHLACLNKSLHPKHMIRPWITHDEDMPDDLEAVLESEPSLT